MWIVCKQALQIELQARQSTRDWMSKRAGESPALSPLLHAADWHLSFDIPKLRPCWQATVNKELKECLGGSRPSTRNMVSSQRF